jgi:hypothetical protein
MTDISERDLKNALQDLIGDRIDDLLKRYEPAMREILLREALTRLKWDDIRAEAIQTVVKGTIQRFGVEIERVALDLVDRLKAL